MVLIKNDIPIFFIEQRNENEARFKEINAINIILLKYENQLTSIIIFILTKKRFYFNTDLNSSYLCL